MTPMEKYRKTKKALITTTYSNQKKRSKRRGHMPPTYSKSELRDWLFSQPLFHVLFDNYKRLDYNSDYVPSVDRIDDTLGYTLNNVQLMTWGENNAKGLKDKRSGKLSSGAKRRPVIQMNIDGTLRAQHPSISHASRTLNIPTANLCRAIKHGRTAGGFKWKYDKKKAYDER